MQNLIRCSAFLMIGVWISFCVGDEPGLRLAKILQAAKVQILHTKDVEPDQRELRYLRFGQVVLAGDGEYVSGDDLTTDDAICGLKIDSDTDSEGRLTSETIRDIDDLIPQIQYLVLDRNHRLAEVFIQRLSEFRNLRQLWVEFPTIEAGERVAISDQCLKAIPRMTQLRSLKLVRLDIHDEFFADLSSLTQLRELRIMPTNQYGYANRQSQVDLTAQTLSSVVKSMPKLETLVVSGCPLKGKFDWGAMSSLSLLRSVTLARSDFGDTEASGIGALQQVTELDLQETKITGDVISDIAQMKNLAKLNLRKTNVHNGVTQLSSLSGLVVTHSADVFRDEELGEPQLEFLLKTSDGVSSVNDGAVDLFSLANLERVTGGIREVREADDRLHIAFHDPGSYRQIRLDRRLSDRDLDELKGLSRLASFSVLRDEVITSELTSAIAGHPAIKFVRLGKLKIDAELVEHLSSLPSLESLGFRGGEIHAGAFRSLASATKLTKVSILDSQFVSVSHDRLAGLESAPALAYLTVQTENGADSDCHILARSRSLERLSFCGNFTASSLQSLAKLNSVKSLSLYGITDFDPHTQIREMKNPSLEYLQLNPDAKTRLDSSGVYSAAAVRELGIKMAGLCSCSCMDEESPNATLIPDSAFRIVADELRLKDDYLDELKKRKKLRGWFRIVGPFRRDRLVFHGTQLPFSQGIYFNECDLKTLELIDCRREVGVFGKVDQLKLHEEAPYEEQTAGVSLFLAGVSHVEFTSARRLETITLTGQLGSLSLRGDFPLLRELHPVSTSGLKYLAAPYGGAAPRLTFPDYLSMAAMKDLRLLKIPHTAATDKFMMTAASPLHEIDIRGTAVTDPTLLKFQRIETLRVLKLEGCPRITDAAVSAFRKARPDVQVER